MGKFPEREPNQAMLGRRIDIRDPTIPVAKRGPDNAELS